MFKTLMFISGLLLLPSWSIASQQSTPTEEIFEARVIKILEQKSIKLTDNSEQNQQNLRLKALTGSLTGKEFDSLGIGDFTMISVANYKVGDRVMVQKSTNENGQTQFTVIDSVRRDWLYLLAIIFSVIIIIIGRFKGLKALIGLLISFFIIIKIILPMLLKGFNPILIAIFGAVAILTILIYLTEGFNKLAHWAILSVLISLSITTILAYLFTWLARLNGLVQEEAAYLISLGSMEINFQGLLLAGIIIGSIGVLDDIVIGQLEAVEQIKKANPKLSAKDIFKSAYKIGNAHLGAIVNTLFLTYAGASLPLLLLFSLKIEPLINFQQIINNELIATEIVRTLIGSLGVALSMPIATWLGSYYYQPKKI